VNHTSDAHPWFQAARRAPPGSRKRDYYVWSDTDTKYRGTRIIFTDTEISNWAWIRWRSSTTGTASSATSRPRTSTTRTWCARAEVMQSWAEMGVDGFRLDAIPYLCERRARRMKTCPRRIWF